MPVERPAEPRHVGVGRFHSPLGPVHRIPEGDDVGRRGPRDACEDGPERGVLRVVDVRIELAEDAQRLPGQVGAVLVDGDPVELVAVGMVLRTTRHDDRHAQASLLQLARDEAGCSAESSVDGVAEELDAGEADVQGRLRRCPTPRRHIRHALRSFPATGLDTRLEEQLARRVHRVAQRASVRLSSVSSTPCETNPTRLASCQAASRQITLARIPGNCRMTGGPRCRWRFECSRRSSSILPLRRRRRTLW